MSLNENQHDAVYYDGEKPLIIEAGPGSGKTHVLTERVKFLIDEKNVDPETLLVITFTRKATEELKTRLASKDIPSDVINKMQISTIHGFCFDLLKKYNNFAYDVLDDDYNQKKTLFFLKNKYRLGFKGYAMLSDRWISNVLDKYGEYSTFNVDSDRLVKYVAENHPVSEEYKRLVDGSDEYPYDEVNASKELKDELRKARHLQIAKSYPDYLRFLEENYLVDYDTLQIEALNFLRKNQGVTNYRNILIDEFQDVNPVQYDIFMELLPYAESFTVVGDIDQSIYGFRGALFDYFDKLDEEMDVKRIQLGINYRSTDSIVNLTEEFIRPYRGPLSTKDMTANRDYDNQCQYIVSDEKEEAENILNHVKKLKETGKIENYNDIAILFRSLKGNMVKRLIALFKEEDIPYSIKNFSKLADNSDVRSLMILLWYILPQSNRPHIFSRMEKEWINLKGFTGAKFQPTLWSLSDETRKYLENLQNDFEKEAVRVGKEVLEEETGVKSRIRAFSGLFQPNNDFGLNKTDETMEEIFRKVQRPKVNLDDIENEDDRAFFEELEDLKTRVNANVGHIITTHLEKIKNSYKSNSSGKRDFSRISLAIDLAGKNQKYVDEGIVEKLQGLENLMNDCNSDGEEIIAIINSLISTIKEFDDDLTILDIFYEILRITNFFENPDEGALNNFSIISESMYNFENVMDKTDLRKYFKFLQDNVEVWDEKEVISDGGVQIMTIHKSKGLEFPVVIVPSIREGSFPKEFIDPSVETFSFPNFTFYTPNDCLRYKQDLDHTDEYYHDLEEKRIIYVAITRAQDSVLISFVDEIHPLFDGAIDKGYLNPLNYDSLDKCMEKYEVRDDEILNASYTSINVYENCKFRYGMLYDKNFKVSDSDAIREGSAVHNAFNKINMAKIKDPNVGSEKIDEIITDVFTSTSNIFQQDHEFETFRDNIYRFYEEMGDVRLLESEYGFNILDEGYNIVGSIDLIYEKDGRIGIIDYKNTKIEGNDISKYENQLKIYLHALSCDAKYGDKDVTSAGIYAVANSNLIVEDIGHEEVEKRVGEIERIVEKIKDKDFEKRKIWLCKHCEFKQICNKLFDKT